MLHHGGKDHEERPASSSASSLLVSWTVVTEVESKNCENDEVHNVTIDCSS